MNFVVYILFSASLGKYYVGQTQDLEVRLQQHNSGRGKFTSTGAPWAVVHQQTFATRAEAVRLETTIKKRGIRRYLEAI
ncbi:putative endonuclease [Dyadobacter jejuensis]|uniref:Putative endonuclease n=1 Tax=Dyadobacter jejuensis TaxID=1082580 RepID=A0A316AAU9_9BACT|nr:GIY-YIG nuclease family protein [Dyadobacter jejuensis]PWJ54751.1 putative endonuclease [Dyadobacter jejuensis]